MSSNGTVTLFHFLRDAASAGSGAVRGSAVVRATAAAEDTDCYFLLWSGESGGCDGWMNRLL